MKIQTADFTVKFFSLKASNLPLGSCTPLILKVDLTEKPFTAMTLHKILVELMEDEEKVTLQIMRSVQEVTTPWIKRIITTMPSFLKLEKVPVSSVKDVIGSFSIDV